MATSETLRRGRTAYRILTVLGVALLATAAGVTLATQPASGQADVSTGSLNISGGNQTVDGDVSDVRVQTVANYQYGVPDATRWIVKLQVGPTTDQLETVDYVQEETTDGQASGSVGLDGSVLAHPAFSASDFDPPVAGETQTDVVVRVGLEVRRANGDPVVAQATETVTVGVTDGAELTASVGGQGEIEIVTE